MMVMNAITEVLVPAKFCRITLEPVWLSNEIKVSLDVTFTMQVPAVSCPVAALVCMIC